MIIYARTTPMEYPEHHPLILPIDTNFGVYHLGGHIAGFDPTNVLSPSTSERWLANGNKNLVVTKLVGSILTPCDAVAIHGVVGTVTSVILRGQGVPDVTVPVNSSARTIFILVDDLLLERVELVFVGATVGASVVTFGKAIQMPLPKYGGVTPTRYALQTTMQTDISEGGQYLGATIQRKGYAGSISFDNIKQTFVREKLGYIIDNSPSCPIFLAVRPDRNKKLDGMGDDVLYCVTTSNINPQNKGQWEYMTFTLEYRGF